MHNVNGPILLEADQFAAHPVEICAGSGSSLSDKVAGGIPIIGGGNAANRLAFSQAVMIICISSNHGVVRSPFDLGELVQGVVDVEVGPVIGHVAVGVVSIAGGCTSYWFIMPLFLRKTLFLSFCQIIRISEQTIMLFFK